MFGRQKCFNGKHHKMKVAKVIGNSTLWERDKTLFLCSKHAPLTCYETIFLWVEGLSQDNCVMCFNTSELEEEVLKALLVFRIPTVLLTTEHFPRHNFNVQIERAMDEKRMAVVELERDEPQGSGLTHLLRNRYAVSQANNIVCGYIDPKGSTAPLLHGRQNVKRLTDDHLPMAAEPENRHARWTVGEDKRLLRMYYADMGLHAMHCATKRSYTAIRQRVNSLAMCDEALMGREFEDYVLESLDINADPNITLREWRGDKIMGNIFPQNNSLPDLVFDIDNRHVAVECKWRARFSSTGVRDLLPEDRLQRFLQYHDSTSTYVYLLLGIGGLPSDPESLYLAPVTNSFAFEKLQTCKVKANELKERLCIQPI